MNVRRQFFSSSHFEKAFGSVLSGFWLDVRMFVIVELVALAPTGAVVLGGAALAMCYSALRVEVFRAGIGSIHPSQGAAARLWGSPTHRRCAM